MKLYEIERFLHRHHFRILAKVVYAIIYIAFNCVIPPSVEIGRGSRIAHGVGIVIHPTAQLGEKCVLYQNVTIANSNVTIGNNVLIGSGSVILGPCNIGDGCKVGANTVVNFDVPAQCTVVGTLGHIIKRESNVEES